MRPLVGARRWLLRGLLVLAWALSHEMTLRWMFASLAQPVHLVQRTVFIGLAIWSLGEFLMCPASSHVHPRAMPIVLWSLALDGVARLCIGVNTAQAAVALLVWFALSAVFLDAGVWRRRLILLAVMWLLLPIQSHVDAHVGLPLRLWTAHYVASLLQVLAVPNVTVESIIVTENTVADVASACSGVRTLWYAAALWLCAGFVWPQAAWRRWWLAGALSALVAVGFNTLRVAAVVMALAHEAPPFLAEVAHTALGLLGLAVVAVVNTLACHGRAAAGPDAAPVRGPSWRAQGGLAVLMGALACMPVPVPARTAVENASAPLPMDWPAALHARPIHLSDTERGLMASHASSAEKHRFEFQGATGSLLVVQGGDWRAHHAPELCLLAQGARIEKLTLVGSPRGEFRVLTLQSGSQAALTWFQSGARVVPDLGARLWSQLLRPQEKWVLVTVVTDAMVTPEFLMRLHEVVQGVVAQSGKSAHE